MTLQPGWQCRFQLTPAAWPTDLTAPKSSGLMTAKCRNPPITGLFFGLASENSTSKGLIVWLRIGNTSNQALLRWFVPLGPEIMRLIELGDRLIEFPESSNLGY
jgi:hypothetical protein